MDYDYDVVDPEGEDFYPDFYPDNYALDEDRESPWSEQDSLPPMSAYELLERCLRPTLEDGFNHMTKALAWCFVYRLSVQLSMNCSLQSHAQHINMNHDFSFKLISHNHLAT